MGKSALYILYLMLAVKQQSIFNVDQFWAAKASSYQICTLHHDMHGLEYVTLFSEGVALPFAQEP